MLAAGYVLDGDRAVDYVLPEQNRLGAALVVVVVAAAAAAAAAVAVIRYIGA